MARFENITLIKHNSLIHFFLEMKRKRKKQKREKSNNKMKPHKFIVALQKVKKKENKLLLLFTEDQYFTV